MIKTLACPISVASAIRVPTALELSTMHLNFSFNLSFLFSFHFIGLSYSKSGKPYTNESLYSTLKASLDSSVTTDSFAKFTKTYFGDQKL